MAAHDALSKTAGLAVAAAIALVAGCGEPKPGPEPLDAPRFAWAEENEFGHLTLALTLHVRPDAPDGRAVRLGIRDDLGKRHEAARYDVVTDGRFRGVRIETDELAPGLKGLEFLVDVKVGGDVERLSVKLERTPRGWQLAEFEHRRVE